MIQCKNCLKSKDENEFSIYNTKYGPGIYRIKICKKCRSSKQREWLKNNKEYVINYRLQYKTNYYEKILNYRKKYYSLNKERIKQKANQWNKLNKEKLLQTVRKWRKKNRQKYNAYFVERRNKDPMFKLNYYLGNAIRTTLRNGKYWLHWETLVGYSLFDLKKHLEKQFKIGMTWENYGLKGWHIDHIKPISSFHFISYEDKDFKKCWALNNLQPLWAYENLKKWKKYFDSCLER